MGPVSGYRHFDRRAGNYVYLRRCDLCGADEQDTAVADVEVYHPTRHAVCLLDLCRRCEVNEYDRAQVLVADRMGAPVAEPVPTVMEPDAAEQRIADARARWAS